MRGYKMSDYTVLKDECLSLIAKRFDISAQEIQALNSDEIKNIDLIYTGQTLKIPGQNSPARKQGKRINLQELPTTMATGNMTCGTADFVDILYVPCEPISGKKAWYMVTQVAKDALQKEGTLLANTIKETKGDTTTTLSGLTKLGIMSRFESKMFEQFLDDDDADDYITFIIALKFFKTLKGATIDSKEITLITDWAKKENLTLKEPTKAIVGNQYPAYIPGYTRLDRLVQLNEQLIEKLAARIKKSEDKSKNNAKKLVSDDGTNFKYSKQNSYFTSKKEQTISSAVKKLYKSRPKKDQEIITLKHQEADTYLKKMWYGNEPDFNYDYIQKPPENNDDRIKAGLSLNLQIMNKRGYAVKEQCLKLNELEGDTDLEVEPACLKGIKWRGESNAILLEKSKKTPSTVTQILLIIHDLFTEVKGESLNNNSEEVLLEKLMMDISGPQWAYYPTLALLAQIELALIKIQSEIFRVLGATTKNDALTPSLNKLLWVKMVANARIEQLKSLAFKRAFKGTVHSILLKNKPSTMALVWDETKHKAAEKKKDLFVNKAGKNDLEVTECALISDGILMWVRTPCWYLPGSTHKKGACPSLGHVEPTGRAKITTPKSLAASQAVSTEGTLKGKLKTALKTTTDTTMKEVIDAIKNPTLYTSVDLKGVIDKYKSVFWKANYHYEGGIGPYGSLPAYAVGGEFQLMRFVSSTEGSLNMTLKELKNLKGNIGINKKASLTLFSAQASFMTWLPLETNKKENETNLTKVSGWAFKIPYFVQDDNSTKHFYPAGEFLVKLSASVYGLAAVSCQLSSELKFGPADNETGIGIRGSSSQNADQNLSSGTDIGSRAVPLGNVIDAKSKVDIFAGIEIGGTLEAEVFWRPPVFSYIEEPSTGVKRVNQEVKKMPLKLGAIRGLLAVNAGIGGSAEFRITFQNGMLIVISAASLVMGTGCSGKVAIEVHPLNADRFISCLLNILQESNFSKLALFGETDEKGLNPDFVILNDYLTLGMLLGLSFGKVLLLPAVMWDDFKNKELRGKYAPQFARRIVDVKNRSKMQPWVLELPPETLANLFNCLLSKQKNSDNNTQQANAIILIMNWLANADVVRNEVFVRALIKMSGDNLAKSQGIEALGKNWMSIARLVDEFVLDLDTKRSFNPYSEKLLEGYVLTTTTTENQYQSKGMTMYRTSNNFEAYLASSKETEEKLIVPWHLSIVGPSSTSTFKIN